MIWGALPAVTVAEMLPVPARRPALRRSCGAVKVELGPMMKVPVLVKTEAAEKARPLVMVNAPWLFVRELTFGKEELTPSRVMAARGAIAVILEPVVMFKVALLRTIQVPVINVAAGSWVILTEIVRLPA